MACATGGVEPHRYQSDCRRLQQCMLLQAYLSMLPQCGTTDGRSMQARPQRGGKIYSGQLADHKVVVYPLVLSACLLVCLARITPMWCWTASRNGVPRSSLHGKQQQLQQHPQAQQQVPWQPAAAKRAARITRKTAAAGLRVQWRVCTVYTAACRLAAPAWRCTGRASCSC